MTDEYRECPRGHKFLDDPSFADLPDDVPRCPVCALEKDATQNPYTFKLRQAIEDFKVLDHGCSTHQAYKARRKPRVMCYRCVKMFESRERLKKMGFID